MNTIGIRQFKNEATQIVRRVREDKEEFVITVDGEPVALLSPYSDPDRKAKRQQQVKDWLKSIEPLAKKISAAWPEGVSAADAVAEQRREL